MVFGVFDRLHPGHISFLEQAKKYGDILIVVVARDSVVRELKKKTSTESEDIRISRVASVEGVTRAMLGDEELGSWDVVTAHKPDMICLGYDQQWIKKDIEDRIARGLLPQIQIAMVRAHKPKIFHTSLLTNI